MKVTKLFISILIACLFVFVVGCNKVTNNTTTTNNNQESTTKGDDPVKIVDLTDNNTLDYIFNQVYQNNEVKDSKNGFSQVSDVKKARVFRNGEYQSEFTSYNSRHDIKMEIYNDSKMRFVNLANGYTITIPSSDVTVNYEIAKYRIQMEFDDSILSLSFESSNPYTSNSSPWYTYGSEWLMTHIMNDEFIEKNSLERTIAMNYNFTAANPYGDLTFKDGYDVYFFGIKIKDPKNQIERPYYNIGIVRQKNDPKNFILLVMKSKSEKSRVMEALVESYSRISSKGTPKNYFYSEEATPNPNWDDDTKAYFNKLLTEEYVNWGVFSYSMPGDKDGLEPGQSNYDNMLSNSRYMQNKMETAWQHAYEIYPTYTHLEHAFPLNMARELAGGNGSNGKPVLQFTFQYTTNNNLVNQEVTPIFAILRGDYDDTLRKLAQDIKAYGKPVLFRLNNEMNTDWTSYCGMMTLLDPDIFSLTWQRLYNICEQVGCKNMIWIWNPISISCPYSSWGEDLCYFPGLNYVQLLGGTSYEFNNYSAETAASEIKSFKKHYSDLFTKNCKSFSTNWKLIISEFACGSGGNVSGQLGRNAAVQAKWVEDMWKELNATTPADYVKQIRGAVWFNCNDYSGNMILNRLMLVARPNSSENYNDLSTTLEAFRKGFEDQDKRLGKK